jgi:integrase
LPSVLPYGEFGTVTMNGFIEERPNGKFYARWRDPSGRLRAKSFDRKGDARQHVAEQQVAISRGVYLDESRGKVAFADWAEQYFAVASRKLARTSYARDLVSLNSYVLPRWGRVRISRITKAEVERWVVDLGAEGGGLKGQTLSPATVEKVYQTFRKVMQAAYEDERIPRLPCPAAPPIARQKRKPVRFLTEGEVAGLATTITPLYEATIYIAAYGGFRLGELLALRLDDVDWTRGFIRVDEGLTDVGGHLEFENPKTERAFRTVPMADPALEKLRDHVESRLGWEDPRALLFLGRDGGFLRPNNWRRRHFDPAVERAGLTPLTPHDLRHTAASFFIAEGANPWMLAEILGHRDTRMIDRVYGHLFEKDRQALRDRMSQRARRAGTDNVHRLSG